MIECQIEWIEHNDLKRAYIIEKKHCQKIKQLNLLQSYNYGLTSVSLNRQRLKQAIIHINNQPAGYFQILEAAVFYNIFQALILDRGPIWFEDFGTEDHFEAFLNAFRKEFPKRPGRKIRFIPEIQHTENVEKIISNHGFKKRATTSYQTSWLDLELDEATHLKHLKKRWRNALTKAQKNNLTIEWDDTGTHFKWLMECYAHDKAAKGYDGPSVTLMSALANKFVPERKMLIGRALENDQPIGGILLFCHGRSATYQIGWNSAQGRDEGAHYVLLWDALKQLKQRDIISLDLGGMNETSAKGVKKFKEGLGGNIITLPGLYTG